jgi:hypothetical protein
MKSKIEITKLRRQRILLILKTLFPEYRYITISNSGNITFKKYWISYGNKVNIFELAFTELSKRLSNYRNGNQNYFVVYNDCLRDILSSRKNLIDYIYFEFTKIRTSSKVELLVERSQFALPKGDSNKITIGEVISNLRVTNVSLKNGLGDAFSYIKRLNLESKQDRSDRFRFISLINT